MKRALVAALAVLCGSVSAVAGEIPISTVSGQTAVQVNGLWYWIINGALSLIV